VIGGIKQRAGNLYQGRRKPAAKERSRTGSDTGKNTVVRTNEEGRSVGVWKRRGPLDKGGGKKRLGNEGSGGMAQVRTVSGNIKSKRRRGKHETVERGGGKGKSGGKKRKQNRVGVGKNSLRGLLKNQRAKGLEGGAQGVNDKE